MLPLLVNSRLQPFQTRRTALGFFSFASLTFICRLFGPSKKIKPRIYNHLPPLWAFIKTQVPYLQSLAASFSKTWGVGAYAKSSLCNQQLPDSFFRVADISGIPTFLGPARERPTPRPIAPEGMRGSTTRTPSGSGWRRSIAKKPGGPPGNQTRRAALP